MPLSFVIVRLLVGKVPSYHPTVVVCFARGVSFSAAHSRQFFVFISRTATCSQS
jgi:hypothetical protein